MTRRWLRALYARVVVVWSDRMGAAWARRVNRALLEMSLRAIGIGNYESMSRSGEAPFLQSVLPRLVGPEPTLVDVGAHDGEFASLLLERFPSARIYAFEPHPQTYERLERTVGARVGAENIAISDHVGELELWDYSASEGSPHASAYRDAIATLHHGEPVMHRVIVTTLDDWADARGLARIDFLKIDTEGSEFAALKGAQRLLGRRAIGVVQFEFNEMNVYSRVFLSDFADLLPHHRLYRLCPTGMLRLHPYRPILHELFAFQNVVAVHADLLPVDAPQWISTR